MSARSLPLALLALLTACSLGGGQEVSPSVSSSIPPVPPTGTVTMVGSNATDPRTVVPSSTPAPVSTIAPSVPPSRLAFMTFMADGALLFEPKPVRQIDASTPYESAIKALLAGPSAEEKTRGAIQLFDPSVELERVEVSGNVVQCIRAPCPERHIVRLYFTGNLCSIPGAATNEGTLIIETMGQFPEIAATKVYLDGETLDSVGTVNSLPGCLQP